MGYAVFHRDASGAPTIADVDSLDAAVALVERLRNEDHASDVRVFREVPLEVRTYYKVVVADDEAGDLPASDGADVAHPPASPEVATDAPTAPQEPLPDVAAAPPVAAATRAPEELPGAFSLAPPTSGVPEAPGPDADADVEPARRTSLFGRGG